MRTYYSFDVLQKNMNENPFAKGYITGVMVGDGYFWTKNHQYRFSLEAKDKDFVDCFSENCVRIGLHVGRFERTRLHHIKYCGREYSYQQHYYIATVSSKIAFTIFQQICSDYSQLLQHDFDTIRGFLRGVFDSEGSVTKGYNQHRLGQISLKNYDKTLLMMTCEALRKFGIKSSVYQDCLRIFSYKDLVSFKTQIGFSIQRKQNKLLLFPNESIRTPILQQLSQYKLLKNQGLPFKEIANRLNMNVKTLHTYRWRYGWD